MRIAGRVLATIVGVLLLWLAVSMAISPAFIVPVPAHGEAPQRIAFEPTFATEASRYVASGLLGFFGLTLAVVPWRKRKAAPPSAGSTGAWG